MDKIVLITGGARRIGREMAIYLASKGWNVAIHYNKSQQEAFDLAEYLHSKFPCCKYLLFQADLDNIYGLKSMFDNIVEDMGVPDIIINNASIFPKSDIAETSVDMLDRVMRINFYAPFILTQKFASYNRQGQVINIIDTKISSNTYSHAAYLLSKKALGDFTKMSALEYAPRIRVNAIAPGLILPPAGKGKEYLEFRASEVPMKMSAGVESVMNALDYIMTNKNLTGQILFCDSGESLDIS